MLYADGVELPGGDVIVPGGLGSVLETILNLLPSNVVQTGCLVSNIDWSAPDTIVVTTETGGNKPTNSLLPVRQYFQGDTAVIMSS